MRHPLNAFKAKLQSQKGQGTVEYALITLAIVVIITAVLFATDNPLKTAITDAFQRAADAINNAGTGGGGGA